MLFFNSKSNLVKMWFSAVMCGVYEKHDVPKLLNLQEEVFKLLDEIGFIEEEDDVPLGIQ